MSDFKFDKLPCSLGPQIKREDQTFLYFGGTAYLGIPKHPQFLSLYMDGVSAYGLNNGTSRSNNVQLGIYDEAEEVAADRFGAEAALVSSSGYLAAQLAVKHFADWGRVLYAPASHPALWLDGNPNISGSFGYWSRHVVELINGSKLTRWVLISNSLNNLFPEKYDFSFLKEVHPDKQVLLLVDDSHGIGILGEGRGCLPDLPRLPHIKVLVMASMAKALGVDAGLVLGNAELIAELKQTNAFFGASPPAAAGLHAFIHAEKIYQEELHRLQQRCRYFAGGLGAAKSAFAAIEGFPIYLSEDQHLGGRLQKSNVLISSFAYPDQHSQLLNRIVLSSWHSPQDLDILLNLIRTAR